MSWPPVHIAVLLGLVSVLVYDCARPVPKADPVPCHDSALIVGDRLSVYDCAPGAALIIDEDGPACICPR